MGALCGSVKWMPTPSTLVTATGCSHQWHSLGFGQLSSQLRTKALLLCWMGPREHTLQDICKSFGCLCSILFEAFHTKGLDGAGEAENRWWNPGSPFYHGMFRVVSGRLVDAFLLYRLKKSMAQRSMQDKGFVISYKCNARVKNYAQLAC